MKNLKILHVFTLCTPDGAFGGPQRVALNLAAELRRRRHSVVLAAGARGFHPTPRTLEGVRLLTGPVHTVVPGAGFSGLASPALLRRIGPALRGADIVHVHLSRDLVTLPVALRAVGAGTPLVLQCHGMVDPSDRTLAGPLDAVVTRRLLRRATAVLYLNDEERRGVEAVVGHPLRHATCLPNGVPPGAASAASTPPRDPRLVVFAARLHERKRPEQFVEAAARIIPTLPDARFAILGPDEGRLAAVRQRIHTLGVGHAVSYLGAVPHEEVLRWLGTAAVYVLPAVAEPYAMTVLEAMSMGTPVVVTDRSGLAGAVRDTGAGFVTSPDPASLAHAIGRLLEDAGLRAAAGECGLRATRERFGMPAVVDRLEAIYAAASARPGTRAAAAAPTATVPATTAPEPAATGAPRAGPAVESP